MKSARLLLLCLLPAASSCARAEPAAPRRLATLQDKRLGELSGLAASQRFPGLFWAHNDSGDAARLFLLDKSGCTRLVVNLEGVAATDWEDIAVVGGAENSAVTVADTGDNARSRQSVALYRFRERDVPPQVLAAPENEAKAAEISVRVQAMELRYPKAEGAQDCESLAANASGDLLLVTKSTGPSSFYLARWPLGEAGGAQELRLVAQKQFGSTEPGKRRVREMLATGADFSDAQNRLAVITYATLYAWKLPAGGWQKLDWGAIVAAPAAQVALPPLPQCESVAWDGEGQVLVSSEANGQDVPLWEVPVPAPVAER